MLKVHMPYFSVCCPPALCQCTNLNGTYLSNLDWIVQEKFIHIHKYASTLMFCLAIISLLQGLTSGHLSQAFQPGMFKGSYVLNCQGRPVKYSCKID